MALTIVCPEDLNMEKSGLLFSLGMIESAIIMIREAAQLGQRFANDEEELRSLVSICNLTGAIEDHCTQLKERCRA